MPSFRQLDVWQRAMDLSVGVYRLTWQFPKSETYGLSSQMQRASVSVAANIAEGHGRDSTKEFLHHHSYSLGSLAELETHLTISVRLEYVAESKVSEMISECDQLGKMIRGLQKSLRRKLNEPE